MKKFIIHTNIFLFSAFLLIVSSLYVEVYMIRKDANFKLKKDIKYVVFGHSHPECAFNDSLISNFKNYAKAGEANFYTYFKVKKIIEQNPNVKTIFLEYSNNSIGINKNQWIWGDQMSVNYPILSPFMDLKDKKTLAENNLYGFFSATSISLRHNLTRILTNNLDYSKLDGYNNIKHEGNDTLTVMPFNTDSIKDNISSILELSIVNIDYIKKTIDYCNNANVKIYLIRSPQRGDYSGRNNELKFKEILKTNFKNVEFLDFNNFRLNNSEFADSQHLNYKGAKKFSLYFDKLLKKGLLNSHNKKLFIQKNEDSNL